MKDTAFDIRDKPLLAGTPQDKTLLRWDSTVDHVARFAIYDETNVCARRLGGLLLYLDAHPFQ